jgi:glycine/D-amino acid oxidase-like deaminating enzyme
VAATARDALDRLFRGAILHPARRLDPPARWVRRLARHAVEAGAEIVERESCRRSRRSTPTPWSSPPTASRRLLPELATRLAGPRQVLVTEPSRSACSTPHYARDGYDYWQQLSDGRLVVGGKRDASFETENTSVEETTPLIQERLERSSASCSAGCRAITHRWAGVWGSTPDLLPLVGRVAGRGNVWVAGGYSGHGNVLGLACGDLVARAVVGEAVEELALFDPARFR